MGLGCFSWLLQLLSQHARPFLVNGDSVKVLYSPSIFFNTLKEGVLGARKRVVFSSLYLGTGSRESELVDCFQTALNDSSRSDLKCTLLLDHLRGSRGSPNSRTMLQELVTSHRGRFTLGLYHTPNLRGLLRAVGPQRFNEVMGLQHMKIYIFDDNLLLSGANLSRDYFVDRQDRYVLFKDCPSLADFFADIVKATLSHSFTLTEDGGTTIPSALPFDPLSSRQTADTFKASLSRAIREICKHKMDSEVQEERDLSSSSELDTVVFPLLQMGFCGIRQDETVTSQLLENLREDDTLCLASGYFNLPPLYSQIILREKGTYRILAAAPEANGFYGAKGVAGHVPSMYTHFAKKFLEAVGRSGEEHRVSYWEYLRQGWTFHGKGVWLYPSGEDWPSATLVGSSNYGHRSLTRDLEAQVAMVTRNPDLRRSLHEEQAGMFEHAQKVTLEQLVADPERKLSLWEWVVTQLLHPHV